MTESRFAEGEVSADRDASAKVRPLPARHRLGEFELDSVIGTGGFGIVYRAFDRTLQRTVAVKEYMPAMLALRAGDYTVGLRAPRYSHAFEAGRTAFLNEARLLAQFDHPGLLKVLHFWESHGTAYMVMPFYDGQTLAQRNRRAVRMSEPELLDLLAALLGALDTLHRAQCFHRDIALDNILVQPGGQPVLLDFGAARKLIGDLVDETAMILKPGYAPIEQYTDDPAFRQGPWTDIYALGAVAYALITGELPPAAVVRSIQDQYRPLAGRPLPEEGTHYSERVLTAIDEALALRIEDRPDSVSAFAQRLGLREPTIGLFVPPDRAAAMHAPAAAAVADPRPHPVAGVAAQSRSEPTPAPQDSNDDSAQEATHVGVASTTAPSVDAATETGGREPPVPAMPAAVSTAAETDGHASATRHRFAARRFVLPALTLAAVVIGGVTLLRLALRPSEPTVAEPAAQTTAQLPATPPPVQQPVQQPAKTQTADAQPPAVAPTAQFASSSATSAGTGMPASAATPAPAPALADTAPATESARAVAPSVAPDHESSSPSALAMQPAQRHEPPVVPPAATAAATARINAFRPVSVRLYVIPWGEVYVNGVRRGVSPPFRSMNLAPGTYRIEIRNGTLPPFVRVLTLDVGEAPVDIRYSFE